MSDKEIKLVPCPRCGKPATYSEVNPFRPFCSDRCKILDLGAWADEKYRVEAEEVDFSSLREEDSEPARPPNHKLQ